MDTETTSYAYWEATNDDIAESLLRFFLNDNAIKLSLVMLMTVELCCVSISLNITESKQGME